MIDNKLFNFDEATRRVNGLEALLKGLEQARAEAVMWGFPHARIDEAISKYQKRLAKEKPPILEEASEPAIVDTLL